MICPVNPWLTGYSMHRRKVLKSKGKCQEDNPMVASHLEKHLSQCGHLWFFSPV